MPARTLPLHAPRRRPSLLRALLAALALRRSRRRLAALDARFLDDCGIAPEDARREAARGAWDAPARWRR